MSKLQAVDPIYRWSPNPSQSEFCLDIVTIFCDIDDFCRSLLASEHLQLPTHSDPQKSRSSSLSLSEVMTLLVWFPASHYRTCKHL
jgi:hypothetical protein